MFWTISWLREFMVIRWYNDFLPGNALYLLCFLSSVDVAENSYSSNPLQPSHPQLWTLVLTLVFQILSWPLEWPLSWGLAQIVDSIISFFKGRRIGRTDMVHWHVGTLPSSLLTSRGSPFIFRHRDALYFPANLEVKSGHTTAFGL